MWAPSLLSPETLLPPLRLEPSTIRKLSRVSADSSLVRGARRAGSPSHINRGPEKRS